MSRAFSAGVSALHDPWGVAPGYDERCAFGAKQVPAQRAVPTFIPNLKEL